jgi:hypothetical protein
MTGKKEKMVRWMSRSYYGNNGTYIDINVAGGLLLDKISIGMFQKLGVPSEIDDPTARDLAKKIRDVVTSIPVGEPVPEPEFIPDRFRETYHGWYKDFLQTAGIRNGRRIDVIESEDDRQYMLNLAVFFENSGGLMDESEFYKKFPSGKRFEAGG